MPPPTVVLEPPFIFHHSYIQYLSSDQVNWILFPLAHHLRTPDVAQLLALALQMSYSEFYFFLASQINWQIKVEVSQQKKSCLWCLLTYLKDTQGSSWRTRNIFWVKFSLEVSRTKWALLIHEHIHNDGLLSRFCSIGQLKNFEKSVVIQLTVSEYTRKKASGYFRLQRRLQWAWGNNPNRIVFSWKLLRVGDL